MNKYTKRNSLKTIKTRLNNLSIENKSKLQEIFGGILQLNILTNIINKSHA